MRREGAEEGKMKPYSGLARFERLQKVLGRRNAAARSKSTPEWVARMVGVGSVLIAGAALILQFYERSTPFNVELYIAKIESYREVTSASRELVHYLPDYLFWPDRQGSEARQKLARFRDTMEANSMMWDKPIALKLEELAHLSELVLLGLDGVTESQPEEGLYVLSKEKVKAGASPERQKLLNDVLRAATDSARRMRQELDSDRGRAERSN